VLFVFNFNLLKINFSSLVARNFSSFHQFNTPLLATELFIISCKVLANYILNI